MTTLVQRYKNLKGKRDNVTLVLVLSCNEFSDYLLLNKFFTNFF